MAQMMLIWLRQLMLALALVASKDNRLQIRQTTRLDNLKCSSLCFLCMAENAIDVIALLSFICFIKICCLLLLSWQLASRLGSLLCKISYLCFSIPRLICVTLLFLLFGMLSLILKSRKSNWCSCLIYMKLESKVDI